MKSAPFAASSGADRLLRLGGAVTVIGMVLSLIAMSPVVLGQQLSSVWWALSMTTGAGLVLLLVGVRRVSAARSRAIRALRESTPHDVAVGEK